MTQALGSGAFMLSGLAFAGGYGKGLASHAELGRGTPNTPRVRRLPPVLFQSASPAKAGAQ